MTTEQILLRFLKSEITEAPLDCDISNISEDMLKKAFILAKKHSVDHIFSDAVLKSGLKINEELSKDFSDSVNTNYVLCVRKDYALEELKKLLSEEKIRFLPLKGSVIKDAYPSRWMRNSCDIDILIEEADTAKAVKALCEKLRYTVDKKGTHDISLYSGKIHLELHFRLVEEEIDSKAAKVLENIWELSYPKQGGGYEYIMTDEAFYFYHIAHMAVHFKGSGCGIRNFLDLWVLNNRMTFDPEKRDGMLKEGGLYKFDEEVKRLSEIWFSDKDYTVLSRNMEEYVFKSGSYGSRKNRVAIVRDANKSGFSYWLMRIFKPYSEMKYCYPILKKHPYLLPVMWVKRWKRIIFSKVGKDGIKSEIYESSVFKKEYSDKVKELISDLEL